MKYPVRMRFEKWQGTGNHHIVVERDQLPFSMNPARAIALCDRAFGIGADGVLEISFEADGPRMTAWNADGSQAQNCGNGIRIVAAYLARDGRLPAEGLVLTGEARTYVQIGDDDMVHVQMGRAVLPGGAVAQTLATSAGPLDFLEVSMGNPHAVIDDLDPDACVRTLGPEVEVHARFPNRTNVEFVRHHGPSELTMRVWERGVGETLSCGTGACASAVAAVARTGAPSPVTVHVAGGTLVIDVGPDLEVTMSGPAEPVYVGEISRSFAAHLAAAY